MCATKHTKTIKPVRHFVTLKKIFPPHQSSCNIDFELCAYNAPLFLHRLLAFLFNSVQFSYTTGAVLLQYCRLHHYFHSRRIPFGFLKLSCTHIHERALKNDDDDDDIDAVCHYAKPLEISRWKASRHIRIRM